jgi:hypothetical protein
MAKMPGQAARLIGVLHVLNGVSSQPPEVQEEIPLETVRAGCHLAQFYLGQVTVLQGDGDALHGELTPILRSLLEKVNDIGELNAAQAKRAVWGLRSDAPDKIRQYFNELAAMDLAEIQGTGSRLILKSKVLRNSGEKLRNVDEKLRNSGEKLRNSGGKLRNSEQHQTYIYQETQEIEPQIVEEIEAIQLYDTKAVEPSVDEFCNSEKTSTSSTLAEFETESLTQQGEKAVEESSTISSTVEDSSTISSALPAEFAEGPNTIKKVAARYSLEIVQKAIAQLEVKDPDAAEELRDALELDTATPEASSPPTAAKFKVGDRVQMRSDYITPQLCGQQAVVRKDFGDDKYQIDFGRKIETPFVEPKRFFVIDKKYFHHVTDGEQLEMPF